MYPRDVIDRNLIGKACMCCGGFYPVESMDERGYKITFPDNLGMCEECFNAFRLVVKQEVEKQRRNKETM